MRRRTPVVAASLTLALSYSGCGTSKTSSVPTRLVIVGSAPRRACPARDTSPRRVLAPSATTVLVPGHPTSALICRYWGGSEPGHRARTVAEALQVSRQYVISRVAHRLNALPLITSKALIICPLSPAGGGRTVLFVFRYRGRQDATVLFGGGCGKVTNGRITRDGLPLDNNGEHWAGEGLL